jgi:hypothetical protein
VADLPESIAAYLRAIDTVITLAYEINPATRTHLQIVRQIGHHLLCHAFTIVQGMTSEAAVMVSLQRHHALDELGKAPKQKAGGD